MDCCCSDAKRFATTGDAEWIAAAGDTKRFAPTGDAEWIAAAGNAKRFAAAGDAEWLAAAGNAQPLATAGNTRRPIAPGHTQSGPAVTAIADIALKAIIQESLYSFRKLSFLNKSLGKVRNFQLDVCASLNTSNSCVPASKPPGAAVSSKKNAVTP